MPDMEEQLVKEASSPKLGRRYHKYTFFKVAREWRSLDVGAKEKARLEFLEAVKKHRQDLEVHTYSLVATRGDVDFLIWTVATRLEVFQSFFADILSTRLGAYLDTPYSYLAMTKASRYLGSHKHPSQESSEERAFGRSRFLFVYPFVKKREWYRLPLQERTRIMAEHFKVGHNYPNIKINTGYSFGLDDQEFVLAFEGDNPSDFLDLVEELRGTEASAYTQLETPIFTCLSMDPKAMLELIG